MSERLASGLTPERIVAFVDGELSQSEQREVAAAIAADPAAEAMATAMRQSAAAVAPAFDEALQAPMPPSLAALFAAPPSADAAKIIPFPARPRAGTAARLAIAASLAALLVGLAGGYSLRGLDAPLRPASDGTADPTADRFTAALYQALDRGRPGDSVDYALPAASASGRVTLLGEVPTRSGLPCREFSHVAKQGGQSRTENGIACRGPGGGWETLLLPQ